MINSYWRVSGENIQDLVAEAISDAQAAGMNEAAIADLDVYMCTPAKISNGRVEQWKGWAVVCRDVSPELLSHTLMEAEWLSAFSRSREGSEH